MQRKAACLGTAELCHSLLLPTACSTQRVFVGTSPLIQHWSGRRAGKWGQQGHFGVAHGSWDLDEVWWQANVVLGLLFLCGIGLLGYGVETSGKLRLDLGASPTVQVHVFSFWPAWAGCSVHSVFPRVSLDFKGKKSRCSVRRGNRDVFWPGILV